MTLGIDIETFSASDLTKCGVYRYVEDPSFTILLFAYAWDDEPVRIVDLASGEALPPVLIAAIKDSAVAKAAFNAQFERVCLSRHLGVRLDADGWHCTQAQAAYAGYPLSLKTVAEAMGLEQQKLAEGARLIRYFSMPCRPTQSNGDRTRNLPAHAPDKWQTFRDYCCQDVAVERAIRKRLQPLPDGEKKLYVLDQRINDLGVRIDQTLVRQAIRCDADYGEQALEEAKTLTGLENPASVAQLKGWLSAEGTDMVQLDKKSVQAMRKETTGDVQRMLTLRLALAKTSVKKYVAMQRAVCADGRIRGLLQYYGASRSGRWCLAEDTPVLVCRTDGLVFEKPIQSVSLSDKVWDGDNWVSHEGVVFSGDHEVIVWDGVTATTNHIVYTSTNESMPLGDAKEKRAPLWKGNTPFIR